LTPALRNVLVTVVSVALVFPLTLALDRAAGLYLYAAHRNAGLIWGPYSTVRHSTFEYSYVARINNLGFRGRDFDLRKPSGKRVAVLGDSFTYGWGVDNGQTWPQVLERRLRAAGLQVEVANLGAPGAGPRDYAELAGRAVPLLLPDLVIVAVLQADDLLQSSEDQAEAPRSALRRRLLAFYPNLMQLAGSGKSSRIDVSAGEVRRIWREQVSRFLSGMSKAEKTKFTALPAEARIAYVSGDLNPGLLFYSMRHPSFLLDACDLNSAGTRRQIERMSADLALVRRAAECVNAAVLVVSIPYPAYAGARDLESMRSLGYLGGPEFLTTPNPDETIRRASTGAGLPFVTVLEPFRREASLRGLYYRLDGHLNAAGNETYAALLEPEVARRLSRRSPR
jgi:hypothetical protein